MGTDALVKDESFVAPPSSNNKSEIDAVLGAAGGAGSGRDWMQEFNKLLPPASVAAVKAQAAIVPEIPVGTNNLGEAMPPLSTAIAQPCQRSMEAASALALLAPGRPSAAMMMNNNINDPNNNNNNAFP